MNTNKSNSLKDILNNYLHELEDMEDVEDEEMEEYNSEDLIRDIKQLNYHNQDLHNSVSKIKEVLGNISTNAKRASHHLMNELRSKDEFATGIVKENAKQIRKMAENIDIMLEGLNVPLMKGLLAVEEVGQLLDRYYTIDEIIEEEI